MSQNCSFDSLSDILISFTRRKSNVEYLFSYCIENITSTMKVVLSSLKIMFLITMHSLIYTFV